MDDKDIWNMFNQFQVDNKDKITQEYVEGRISKDEYLRRMKNAKDSNN